MRKRKLEQEFENGSLRIGCCYQGLGDFLHLSQVHHQQGVNLT